MGKFGAAAAVTGLIVFGTTTSLFAKVVYELKGEGTDGVTKYFRKPWAMTTVMFAGMSFLLPFAFLLDAQKKRKQKSDLDQPLLYNQVPQHGVLKEIGLLCIPTIFDLIATVLMNVGLLSVTASVYQMMRGAEMIFAALFAVLFLQRRLNRVHMLGILLCTIGITMVGSASLLSGEGSATQTVSTADMLLGMSLIVLSQAVQAAQLTFEDFFMADLNIDGMKIVGYEGVIGFVIMSVVMLPAVYFLPGEDGAGIHENTIDTFHLVGSSPSLQIIIGVDMMALLFYNMSGMAVTGHLGAVFRTVLETMRTLFVWLLGLLLFYTPLGGGELGESWTVYSYLQAAGFVVLVSGTVVYGKGDEEAARRALQEAVTAALVGSLAPDATANQDSEAAAPLLLPQVTQPVAMHGYSTSYKATLTMNAESLSSSMRRNSAHNSVQHGRMLHSDTD